MGVVLISTADVEVGQDPGLVDAEDGQGPDQVLVAVEGDVVHRRSPDQDLVHQEIARGVGVGITRDQGPGKAGADQGQVGETKGKERMSRGASPARRKTKTRTRTETSHVPDPRRPGRSLAPEKSPVLDRKLAMAVFTETYVLERTSKHHS